jgi:hypothetical protein
LGIAFLLHASTFAGLARACEPVSAHVEEMSSDEFWATMGRTSSCAENWGCQLLALRTVLSAKSASDLVSFDLAFHAQMAQAHTWRLYGAAYIAHGGLSEDGFASFRRWLISKGQRTFHMVTEDPDSLGDFVPPGATSALEFDLIADVAGSLWTERTCSSWDALSSLRRNNGMRYRTEPRGSPFSSDDELLAKQYPRVWRRFADHPLG